MNPVLKTTDDLIVDLTYLRKTNLDSDGSKCDNCQEIVKVLAGRNVKESAQQCCDRVVCKHVMKNINCMG